MYISREKAFHVLKYESSELVPTGYFVQSGSEKLPSNPPGLLSWNDFGEVLYIVAQICWKDNKDPGKVNC